MNRRQISLLGLSALAMGAGAIWRWQQDHSTALTAHGNPGTAQAAATDFLWDLHFQTPGDTTIELSAFQGKPLLLNFWATWCPPCIKEMPLLDSFYQQHRAKGWQVLGLAIDNPEPVKDFLRQHPVIFPIAQAGFSGVDLSRQLGNPSGSLPFTVVIDRQGEIKTSRVGSVDDDQLQAWVAELG
jgi:thiol-disulfide isomerase/thioredoxin